MPDLDDARLTEFLDLAFDAFCARRAAELIDPEQLLPALDAALAPARVERWQTRLLGPMRDRIIARARASALTLSVWLPDDVTATLADLLATPVYLPRKAVEEAVASEQVRESVRNMLQEALSSFITKSTAPGDANAGAGGAIKGALGWGARVAGGAARGLLGSLSTEVQKQLQERVRDFVDGQVATLQQRLVERLTSKDMAKALGLQRKRGFLSALKKKESEAAEGAAKLPHDKLDPLVPRVVAHNLARAELREAVVAEVRAALEEASKQTVGELLEEAGLREIARAALHRHALPVARALVRSEAFGQWWERAQGA
jgi:hypothetical protein